MTHRRRSVTEVPDGGTAMAIDAALWLAAPA